MDMNSADVREV